MAAKFKSAEDLKDEVKSTAVVKYSVPKPKNFLQLKCNTDLNLPPSNWLSDSTESYGLQHTSYQHKEFSSFRMAHLFPDCVGEVDVVSDSENIKNLLKIPYNKRHISMVVHRVGNTLLLDNFDIYNNLLRSSECDWEWLRSFFLETVESSILHEERVLSIKNKKNKALKQKSLVSKFLYHSLVESEDDDKSNGDIKANIFPSDAPPPPPLLLPEPSQTEKVPDPTCFEHKYNRNVVWTFEDIEMLIGTDMPIFGGGTHPCISLRLRDMKKPISVLTGIDYWLDNLMSNVPEVVMCYHLNGIVQKYELVKTEDLPNFEDSKFSPNLIRDVAQSILSFLKSNATRAGHTYWLFKGKDEEVVKLYDLTSLGATTTTNTDDNDQNPFTVPVAMLLYRVARNMKHSKDSYQPGTIRMLLRNCIKLLPPEKYAEIVTSSHYMLSDLYVPVETNAENPNLVDENVLHDGRYYFFQDEEENEGVDEDPMKFLNLNSNKFSTESKTCYKPPQPITGSIEERCLESLGHIVKGLKLLQYFKKASSPPPPDATENNVPMANPTEPIPMPFTRSAKEEAKEKEGRKRKKKDRGKKSGGGGGGDSAETPPNSLLPTNTANTQALPTWQESSSSSSTKSIKWKDHLKILLYEKIVLNYSILSENNYKLERFGDCVRCLGILFRAILITDKLTPSGCSLKLNCLYERAGDCFLMIVHHWQNCDSFRSQLTLLKDEDEKVLEQIKNDERFYHINLLYCNFKCISIYDIRTIEQILLNCLTCYEESFKLSSSEGITRRLGNSLNEIGSYYLNQAKSAGCSKSVREFSLKSEPYLRRASEIFEREKDYANTALINANLGHLHRLMAYGFANKEKLEVSLKERNHFKKALGYYEKALLTLGERDNYPNIWDAVNWEMSTTLYTFACTVQENTTEHNLLEADKEVIDLLQKSLAYCDVGAKSSKAYLYHIRAGSIHHKLASMFHTKAMVFGAQESKRNGFVQLANKNYCRAARMFEEAMDAVSYLTSQMQKFALFEWIADISEPVLTKIHNFKYCLNIILETKNILFFLVDGQIEIDDTDLSFFDLKTKTFPNLNCISTLLVFIKQRIQHVLKNLVKLSIQLSPPESDIRVLACYKACYNESFKLDSCSDFKDFLKTLYNVIREIYEKMKM